jgi:hypothetical protein
MMQSIGARFDGNLLAQILRVVRDYQKTIVRQTKKLINAAVTILHMYLMFFHNPLYATQENILWTLPSKSETTDITMINSHFKA